jgi:hypothetical protein
MIRFLAAVAIAAAAAFTIYASPRFTPPSPQASPRRHHPLW